MRHAYIRIARIRTIARAGPKAAAAFTVRIDQTRVQNHRAFCILLVVVIIRNDNAAAHFTHETKKKRLERLKKLGYCLCCCSSHEQNKPFEREFELDDRIVDITVGTIHLWQFNAQKLALTELSGLCWCCCCCLLNYSTIPIPRLHPHSQYHEVCIDYHARSPPVARGCKADNYI